MTKIKLLFLGAALGLVSGLLCSSDNDYNYIVKIGSIFGAAIVLFVFAVIKSNKQKIGWKFGVRSLIFIVMSCLAFFLAANAIFFSNDVGKLIGIGIAGLVGALVLSLALKFLLVNSLKVREIFFLCIGGTLFAMLAMDTDGTFPYLFIIWQTGMMLTLAACLNFRDGNLLGKY